MKSWPKHPVIYEINTWAWLEGLSRQYQRVVDLATVPRQEWDAIASQGFDAVWFMGVWERSPAGIDIAMRNQGLLEDFRRALPDFSAQDNVGSPYCVRRYVVDEHLGGPQGLAAARETLGTRGIRLVLDFVPNHVAPDHAWVFDHPEYFIQGSRDDLTSTPWEFFEAGGKVFAFGRDPYFPPWMDTAQLNAFHPGLRRAATETMGEIAEQCDGMRCDMAMLLVNEVFQRTWGARAGARPESEFWREVIGALRARQSEVILIAEAYWDLEWELQQQGFDFCYDKRLYDRLAHDSAESVRLHLLADLPYQERLIRFIENHDEPRAYGTFGPERSRAVAVTVATLPGARLFHEGQLEGRRIKLPVQLGRRPEETADVRLQAFYGRLLEVGKHHVFRDGDWRLCERSGWPDNASYLNLVGWCWRRGEERWLIVVNLSGFRSQACVRVPWDDLAGQTWRLSDAFSGEVYEREGNEMLATGLFVDLAPWGFHCLRFARE